MIVRHLEILEAVAETGTFTGAAKKLYMTQSAVSHAVAELEKQAGTALFERHPKGAALTRCGVSLLEESRHILTACRNFDRRITCLEENTPVTVVSSITIASFLLPDILREFKASCPEVKVSVRVARACLKIHSWHLHAPLRGIFVPNSLNVAHYAAFIWHKSPTKWHAQLPESNFQTRSSANAAIEILRRGKADIACWEGIAPKGDFYTIRLGAYQLCAACAPGFHLPEQEMTPERLCAFPLLLREPGSAIRDTFDSRLALAGLKAEPVWESVNSFALIRAAEAGLGITILPEQLLTDSLLLKKLRLIRLEGMEMENQMMALFHRDRYITKPLQILTDRLKRKRGSFAVDPG